MSRYVGHKACVKKNIVHVCKHLMEIYLHTTTQHVMSNVWWWQIIIGHRLWQTAVTRTVREQIGGAGQCLPTPPIPATRRLVHKEDWQCQAKAVPFTAPWWTGLRRHGVLLHGDIINLPATDCLLSSANWTHTALDGCLRAGRHSVMSHISRMGAHATRKGGRIFKEKGSL